MTSLPSHRRALLPVKLPLRLAPTRNRRRIAPAVPLRPIAIANRHPRLRLDRRAIALAIRTLDAHGSSLVTRNSSLDNSPVGELSVVFLTDSALARLHADFLDDPSMTDVITFSGDPALGTAGEICISADAALRHLGLSQLSAPRRAVAKRRRVNSQLSTPNSFSTELTLYLVHGWLHLAGYDDLIPAKKRAMRRAEARALRLLRTHAAIPAFALRPRRAS